MMFSGTNLFAMTIDKDEFLYVSGETIGIKLDTGVIITGIYDVNSDEGLVRPAEKLRQGDQILRIDGIEIDSIEKLNQVVRSLEKENLLVEYSRDNKIYQTTIKPALKSDGVISLGIYVKDRVLGVGTLTYIIPQANIYGALGHSISADFISGTIVKAEVKGIKKSSEGAIGEKKATINDDVLGAVEKNTETGIHGKIIDIKQMSGLKSYQIGLQDDCELGNATILTTIDGEKIEEFAVEIIELDKSVDNKIKGIKLKVIDKRLLSQTNGIVQGMSGSPIIQNGKLIGAVTHVIMASPQYGYGIYIERMLNDMDVFLG